MKRGKCKIFAGLLALAMAISFIPAATWAAGPGELAVNGVDILKAEDYTVQCGPGRAVYDPDTQTLTLENAVVDTGHDMGTYTRQYFIDSYYTGKNLTINLVGDNFVGTEDKAPTYGIWSDNDITIQGEGTLTVYANNAGIYPAGELTIDGATVNFVGKAYDYGIGSFKSNLIIKNGAKVSGESAQCILVTDTDYGGYIRIIDSTVKIADSDTAISCYNQDIEIINSKVEATSKMCTLFSNDITLTDSTIDAVSTEDWASWANKNLRIKGSSTLTAQGERAALGAYNSFLLVPSEGQLIDVTAGADEAGASKIEISPLDKETDLYDLGVTSIKYFHSELHKHLYDRQNASDGYKASDANCEEAARYHYSCQCGAKGTETFSEGKPAGHDYGEPVWNWSDDYSAVSVTFTCKNDAFHIYSPKPDLTSVITDATVTEDGRAVYTAYVTVNGKTYTDEQTVVIPATGHQAATEWKSDGESHWHECIECGEKLDESPHTFEWVMDKEATENAAGLRHKECSVCGYAKYAEVIPAMGTADTPKRPKPPADKEEPAANVSETTGETGDNSNIPLWFSLMLAAGVALTGTAVYGRKKKYNR